MPPTRRGSPAASHSGPTGHHVRPSGRPSPGRTWPDLWMRLCQQTLRTAPLQDNKANMATLAFTQWQQIILKLSSCFMFGALGAFSCHYFYLTDHLCPLVLMLFLLQKSMLHI